MSSERRSENGAETVKILQTTWRNEEERAGKVTQEFLDSNGVRGPLCFCLPSFLDPPAVCVLTASSKNLAVHPNPLDHNRRDVTVSGTRRWKTARIFF